MPTTVAGRQAAGGRPKQKTAWPPRGGAGRQMRQALCLRPPGRQGRAAGPPARRGGAACRAQALRQAQHQARAEGGCGPCGRKGPPFSGVPTFIHNPSHFISLTQQLLVRFCLVSKSNFSRSFKQTPISSLQYETKKIYSSRLSTRPFISGRPPNFLFLPSFLVGSTEPSILS